MNKNLQLKYNIKDYYSQSMCYEFDIPIRIILYNEITKAIRTT